MIRTTGDVKVMTGIIVVLEPPRRMSYTWQWDGEGNESLVDFHFEEAGGRTTVSITHTQLIDESDALLHAAGWNGMLAVLAALESSYDS